MTVLELVQKELKDQGHTTYWTLSGLYLYFHYHNTQTASLNTCTISFEEEHIKISKINNKYSILPVRVHPSDPKFIDNIIQAILK